MKKYILVEVKTRDSLNGVSVTSTDPSVLNWVLTEVRKVVPKSEWGNYWGQNELFGFVLGIQFKKLNNQDANVQQYIFKILCDNGYEPFAIATNQY